MTLNLTHLIKWASFLGFAIGFTFFSDRANAMGITLGCPPVIDNYSYSCSGAPVRNYDEFVTARSDAITGTPYLTSSFLDANHIENPQTLTPLPNGWTGTRPSISPDNRKILITARRPSCVSSDCNFGHDVLWLAYWTGTAWNWVNLTPLFSPNHDVHNIEVMGWTTWLSDSTAVFNAKIQPDPNVSTENQDARAYQFNLRDSGPSIREWDTSNGEKINNDNCFVGRMSGAGPYSGPSCAQGQRVAFARRCTSIPKSGDSVTDENYAWYNTRYLDGTGGACPGVEQYTSVQVPVFKVYVVEVDNNCQPTAFDSSSPAHTPDSEKIFKHMGAAPEWGDGEPALSPDGNLLAFWTNRGYDVDDPNDNCAGFVSYDGSALGNAASRVRVCSLNSNLACVSGGELPKPTNFWWPQTNPNFYMSPSRGEFGVFTFEEDGTSLKSLSTMTEISRLPKTVVGPHLFGRFLNTNN